MSVSTGWNWPMLNGAFDAFGDPSVDFYPQELRPAIDALNERIYDGLNNGVYRAGFAATQEAYEEAVDGVFACLDDLEQRLDGRTYLLGERLTETDWRTFMYSSCSFSTSTCASFFA